MYLPGQWAFMYAALMASMVWAVARAFGNRRPPNTSAPRQAILCRAGAEPVRECECGKEGIWIIIRLNPDEGDE